MGCGTIGAALARTIERDYADVARIVALVDRSRDRALLLQRQLTQHPPLVTLPTLIRTSRLVIEAASPAVAARVACLALAADRDVLIMSTGGLLAHHARVFNVASRSRGRLAVPSGGLCGLDGVKALALGTIRRIQLTTRKPSLALASAPFVQRRRLHLGRLRAPQVIFEGSPSQAIRAFPQNTNVAATMVLATLSLRRPPRAGNAHHDGRPTGSTPLVRPVVRVIADPTAHVNSHELEVDGDCGRIRCRMESRPTATNPKTSEVAVRSALATLAELFHPVRIGT